MLISKHTSDKRMLLENKGHHTDEGEFSKAHCNPKCVCTHPKETQNTQKVTALWEQQKTPQLEVETSDASQ